MLIIVIKVFFLFLISLTSPIYVDYNYKGIFLFLISLTGPIYVDYNYKGIFLIFNIAHWPYLC